MRYESLQRPTFIAELGSGNTCRNNLNRIRALIDGVAAADTGKYDVKIKFQLFDKVGDNLAMSKEAFRYAHTYAFQEYGREVSASVFSEEWLGWLLDFGVSWVKLANIPELHYMASLVPEDVIVYTSYPRDPGPVPANVRPLCCVRKYPAKSEDYTVFSESYLRMGISDHTIGWGLLDSYQPEVFEKHIVDIREEQNPDAGPFAVTLEELWEVL
jgi:hypothetical protein